MFDKKAYAAKWREQNKEKMKDYLKNWRADNPDRVRENWNSWTERSGTRRADARKENIEEYRNRDRDYYDANKETIKEKARQRRRENPDKALAQVHARRARKIKANRVWDEDLTKFVTQQAAALAKLREKAFGFKWHVDHIIPLRGSTVCGLHVWNNIQVIPAHENLRKGNKLLANTMLEQH
jgi:hypothetical protein